LETISTIASTLRLRRVLLYQHSKHYRWTLVEQLSNEKRQSLGPPFDRYLLGSCSCYENVTALLNKANILSGVPLDNRVIGRVFEASINALPWPNRNPLL